MDVLGFTKTFLRDLLPPLFPIIQERQKLKKNDSYFFALLSSSQYLVADKFIYAYIFLHEASI